MTKKQKKLLIRIISGFLLFVGVFFVERLLSPEPLILLLLYLIPYFVAGYDVLAGCVKNIIHGRVFDEEFLMTVATVGAIAVGEYPESVFVMLFYQAGELFQNIAVGKSRRSISELMELFPEEATVIRNGREETVFPEEISVGETLLVRAGEKIPVDCVVTQGESTLDMKALTGESAPVDVYEGISVKAGSINLTGVLTLQAEREQCDSTAAKILELVENSTLNKAKSERFLTKFSRVYTPAVVILAFLIALVPSLITGDWKDWVYRALIFLVVSCPCALVISVPLSFFGGIGCASKHGILVKGAAFLETLGKADVFVFDKTGTLTTGEFTVNGIFPENGFTADELLQYAASAEYHSSHPLARGIKGSAEKITPPESVKEMSGMGLEAVINGRKILVGNKRFLVQNNIELNTDEEESTCVYLSADGKFMGRISLCDTPKDTALKAVSLLKKEGISKIVMLTGDGERAARPVADKLGISEYKSGLLPADKAEEVKKLLDGKKKNRSVVFVGDGINDAPVLALSDVGIAMGGVGSDAAIEAADIVIMDDKPEKCALGIKIAKKTQKIVKQNVVFALGVKFLVLILASLGLTSMWLGVIADVGVAVIAILNSVRTTEGF